MARIKLCFVAIVMALCCSAAKGSTCDDTLENGGMIFLRASVVALAQDKAIKVKISTSDFNHIKSLLPECDLTVQIKHPYMKIKLNRFSSNVLYGFESSYARFVILTGR